MVELLKKPAFCLESGVAVIRLNDEAALVEDITVVCVLLDLFPPAGRSDGWYWKQGWNVPEDVKGEIKMNTMRVLMGTHFQLQPRQPKENNGIDE